MLYSFSSRSLVACVIRTSFTNCENVLRVRRLKYLQKAASFRKTRAAADLLFTAVLKFSITYLNTSSILDASL